MVKFDKFVDYFKISISSIAKRRIRSWLTMVGIFIGIAAVVALISLGQGLEDAISEEFQGLGANTIVITPEGSLFGAGGVASLDEDDIETVERTNGIDKATGYMFSTAKIEWDDEIAYNIVSGMQPKPETFDLFSQSSYSIEKGREFKSSDKYKAIIGYDYANSDAYDKHLDIGSKVYINDKEFEVIGIWEQVGNQADDRSIALPIDTAREILSVPERIDSIIAEVKETQDPAQVALKVEESLRKEKKQKVGEENFNVQTLQELVSSFLTILNIVTTVLSGVAAISLVVGGVGIMNTMYTAVLERTKEIGIMKAIGAKNEDILTMFLIESGLLGIFGGLIGISLGAGMSSLAAYLAQTVGGFEQLQAAFPWYLIVGALAFSFTVGVLSGVLPARQAAYKNPVDALRYE